MNDKKEKYFTSQLLAWNKVINRRAMPWKGEKDPYKIWLSEIILQQTRVEQGLAYYNRYIQTYQTIRDLAAAPDTDVFKLWEGLGYYSRCKNLLTTARLITNELEGKFPETFEKILALKGIGPYTASAIASFAYNLPYAVVDGNVMRVLARYFAISTAIGSTEGKNYFSALATKLLAKKEPANYNQAIMDFGATVCKPQLPLCPECVLQKECAAFRQAEVDLYPVKGNKLIKKERWFYYIVAEYKQAYYIRKRTAADIWQNLHEFILIEKKQTSGVTQLLAENLPGITGATYEQVAVSKTYKQQLTHQTIHGCFIHIKLHKEISVPGYELIKRPKMAQLAFPRFITNYFADAKNTL